MTVEHDRVKKLFLAAVDLPNEDRIDFVRRETEDAPEIGDEVVSLLKHHSEKTILSATDPAISPPIHRSNVRPDVAETIEHDEGTRREIDRETAQLLRSRLMAFTMVLVLGISTGLLMGLIGWRQLSLIVHLGSVGVMLGIFFFLKMSTQIQLRQLRLAELAILLTTGLVTAYTDWIEIQEFADANNPANVIMASSSIYTTWTLVILIYGVFMPNTWQRAAIVLIPAALFPHAVTLVARLANAAVAEILTFERLADWALAPLIATGVSIYAANIIHRVRLNAIQARRLAQYHVKAKIGSGGMGDVYEAEHSLLKRRCAIKLIREPLSTDPKTLARFEREVNATAALTHPNTIEIFDYGSTEEGGFYYVMELLPGMSLQELVDRFGPVTPSRAVFLLKQACNALREAHEAGMIHRDIKPANLFASERGGLYDFAKLLDFGLVREVKLDSDLTGVNTIGGTPLYMAPEQAVDTASATVASDIYAIGAVGYFLLTGKPPFQGNTFAQILIAHASVPVTPMRELVDVPQQLDDAILRCLAKTPATRFSSVVELRDSLDQIQFEEDWSFDLARRWWLEQAPDKMLKAVTSTA